MRDILIALVIGSILGIVLFPTLNKCIKAEENFDQAIINQYK